MNKILTFSFILLFSNSIAAPVTLKIGDEVKFENNKINVDTAAGSYLELTGTDGSIIIFSNGTVADFKPGFNIELSSNTQLFAENFKNDVNFKLNGHEIISNSVASDFYLYKIDDDKFDLGVHRGTINEKTLGKSYNMNSFMEYDTSSNTETNYEDLADRTTFAAKLDNFYTALGKSNRYRADDFDGDGTKYNDEKDLGFMNPQIPDSYSETSSNGTYVNNTTHTVQKNTNSHTKGTYPFSMTDVDGVTLTGKITLAYNLAYPGQYIGGPSKNNLNNILKNIPNAYLQSADDFYYIYSFDKLKFERNTKTGTNSYNVVDIYTTSNQFSLQWGLIMLFAQIIILTVGKQVTHQKHPIGVFPQPTTAQIP